MNRDIVKGNWKQFRDKVKVQWGKLTDYQRDMIDDKHVELMGKVQTSPKEDYMMKEEILRRRVVLRGVLAVGCSLFIPVVLSGCDSKKGTDSTSSAPAGTPGTSADSAAPAAKKVSQASVQYQFQPKGEQKCGNCMNFIAESSTCKLVDGQISPSGWCILWAKKA